MRRVTRLAGLRVFCGICEPFADGWVFCRSFRECTSTGASRWRGISSRRTTEMISSGRLGRRRARQSCTRRQEGNIFPVTPNLTIQVSGKLTLCSLIGIGEIILLPLDVLKIKRQTNPEAFRGRGVLRIVRDEGFGLYRGWGWTAARNAPGSFAVCSSVLLPLSTVKLTAATALRWLGVHQGICLQAPGLQQGELAPELRRVHCRRVRLPRRLGAPGRHQDSYPEQELRESGERLQDLGQHGEERGSFQLLQGPRAEGEQSCHLHLSV